MKKQNRARARIIVTDKLIQLVNSSSVITIDAKKIGMMWYELDTVHWTIDNDEQHWDFQFDNSKTALAVVLARGRTLNGEFGMTA